MSDRRPGTRPGAPALPVLAVAAAMNVMAGSLYAWSAMVPALNAAFGLGAGAGGLVFSLAVAAFTAAVLATPRLPGPGGLAGAGIAAVAGALALALATRAAGAAGFIAAFSLGFGAASGVIYLRVLALAGQARRPWLSTPAMVACFGLGAVAFAPALRGLVAAGWGLSALLLPTAGLALTGIAGVLLARAMPAAAPRPGPRASRVSGLPAPAGIMALLWAGFFTGSVAGLMTLGLGATMIESRGAPLWLSAATLAGIALANTAGRLGAAGLAALLPLGAMMPLAALLSLCGLIAAALTGSASVTATALIAISGGYGLTAAGYPVLTRAFTGAERFEGGFSLVFTAWGAAGLIGPFAAGRLFERSGSFTPAFAWGAAAALAAFLLAGLLARRLARLPTREPDRR